MTDSADAAGNGLLADLTQDDHAHLDARGWVKVAKDIVWIEPGGRARREPLASSYYLATRRGMFRVSRLTREVIEV